MCDICNGHPNCPVCGEETEMIECPQCDGKGNLFDDDGDEYTCFICNGDGEIESERYEPDPDEKHDNRY